MAGDGRLGRRAFLVCAAAAATGGVALWLREILTPSGRSRSSSAEQDTRGTTAAPERAEPAEPAEPTESSATPVGRWSDPGTWPDGRVPAVTSSPTIDRPVLLDTDAEVAGLTITDGGSLVFDPEGSRELISGGNIVVTGRLVMRPAHSGVNHSVVFSGVNERGFAGDGTEPIETDVGLWLLGRGVADLGGTPRLAWTRARMALAAGAVEVDVEDEPAGWRPDDELALTPTGRPKGINSEDGFELATIASVSGRVVRLRRPLRRDHPRVELSDGRAFGAEILNLSRNVQIAGTPTGRGHILIHSSRPQSIRFAVLRHLGPRHPSGQFTQGVVSRYPLHFHLCADGSRGSVVEGTVVRDAGNHAFVPHTSHGVTFRDCISFDTYDEPYWWDQAPSTRVAGPPTDDTIYQRCIAALVRVDPSFRGYRLTGFSLGRGRGNVARGCVAVGVQGNGDASGFHWPEGSEGLWVFEHCVAHNNVNGIFTWQNTSQVHTITDLVAYHNHESGISHGAYGNPYLYQDSILYGNAAGAVLLHAVSRDDGIRFANLICDGADQSDYLVVAAKHVFVGSLPTRFTRCHFSGAREAAFGVLYEDDDGPGEPDFIEILDCAFDGNEFWLANSVNPRTELRVRDPSLGRFVLRRRDQTGEVKAAWNASVTSTG